MGLATSQVRLLALTSRKADVEMQIQINSKRKTMLTREATELSKLYYAKLQNSKIQYATTNGYKDVNYGYLMAQDSDAFFDAVVNRDSSSSIDLKMSDSMILTDNYGRVILSDTMLDVVLMTLNDNGRPYTNKSVESLTLGAMKNLFTKVNSGASSAIGTAFTSLYNATAWSPSTSVPTEDQYKMGYNMLKYLFENGVVNGGKVFKNGGNYYASTTYTNENKITLEQGTFYIVVEGGSYLTDTNGSMYWPGSSTNGFYAGKGLDKLTATQMCHMFDYYGAIFSAAFNGSANIDSRPERYFNVAIADGDVIVDSSGKYARNGNSKYLTATTAENLQDGLKSGVYQLVNVSSNVTGGYAKAQGLDYFVTQSYLVEKTDTSERETITAWYNAARADLSEKESYWDTEITALSSELNTITTEIDSVKKLREDAISSTFKWGSA